jgi:hypothetical protein
MRTQIFLNVFKISNNQISPSSFNLIAITREKSDVKKSGSMDYKLRDRPTVSALTNFKI